MDSDFMGGCRTERSEVPGAARSLLFRATRPAIDGLCRRLEGTETAWPRSGHYPFNDLNRPSRSRRAAPAAPFSHYLNHLRESEIVGSGSQLSQGF
ncbi:hypothetical protein J6590_012648 [Homalodisca vitripennis]|nr:hypothetical protein J6590_012648 [Homalodisca vitripennis]